MNALLLLIAIVVIAVEAIQRFAEPQPVAGTIVMIVAGIGIAVNTATALLFMSGRKGDLNIRGAFLHMAADAGCVGGCGLRGVHHPQGRPDLDRPGDEPRHRRRYRGEHMGAAPGFGEHEPASRAPGLDPEEIGGFLRDQHGVQEIHDLHVWPMSTTETALTVHLLVPGGYPDTYTARVAAGLKDRFGIDHATIQIETDPATPCDLESDKTV